MKYRAEIDGLRAVAVIPVMLFHAGIGIFSGGFVGVDIFFVISGYLITTILINDIEKDRFSIVNFYERRARRILPALFAVMLFCLPFAWMWMLPDQMKNFSQSLLAVSLFLSNFLFWKESGYFAAAGEEKPLLHTWSLAVEEQYYIFFPVFLFLAWRFGRQRVFWMIVTLSAASLLSSEWMGRKYPDANFYLAPSRVWELFAGSITAFLLQKRDVISNNVLSILGMAAIIFSILAFDKTTIFPGLYALVPVIGTAFIILFAGHDTLVGKGLSNKGLVGIGLISYSAYLWHQPLLAFARIRLEDPGVGILLGACALALVLAYISWRYIERPFRLKGDAAINRGKIFMGSIIGAIAFIMIGVLGHRSQGFIQRLPSDLQVKTNLSDPGGYPCPKDQISCITGNELSQKHMLLYGDSHANHIARALVERFESNYKITLVVGNSCFMGQKSKDLDIAEYPQICRAQIEYLKALEPQQFDVVITAQYWSGQAYGLSSPEQVKAAIKERTEDAGTQSEKFIILSNNPQNPKVCLAQNYLFGVEKNCETYTFERLFETQSKPYETEDISFIHPYKFLKLTADKTGPATDFHKTYLDNHHLTKTGSMKVVDEIERLIE